ncbi:MAG: ATP synthase subunit I [Candidatus Abyssubacteria bacterium]
MNEMGMLVMALLAGAALGAFYFGALWLTVCRLSESRRPSLLMFGSFYLRNAVALLGLYFVMGGHWERLALGVVGFIVMRECMVRRLKRE